MINKINTLKPLISENNFEDAYNKLLHDIKPKLTGLKTDENEDPWDGGIFKNPWVINDELQEALRLICNEILGDTKILIETIESLKIHGYKSFNMAISYSGAPSVISMYNIFLLFGFITIISIVLHSIQKKK